MLDFCKTLHCFTVGLLRLNAYYQLNLYSPLYVDHLILVIWSNWSSHYCSSDCQLSTPIHVALNPDIPLFREVTCILDSGKAFLWWKDSSPVIHIIHTCTSTDPHIFYYFHWISFVYIPTVKIFTWLHALLIIVDFILKSSTGPLCSVYQSLDANSTW